MQMILDMSHACDVIRIMAGGAVNSLISRMGTGGNNVPLWMEGDETMGYVIRRLCPEECEALQGFPKGFTDIGEWVDEKGKVHKPSDSARYKALGNSIAIPQHFWYLKQMAKFLPEGATHGSLFSGIGGFDLAWETIHGEGTSRWSSEIEHFCVALLKKRFGEE